MALLTAGAAEGAGSVVLEDVGVERRPGGAVVSIRTSSPPRYQVTSLDRPPRLLIDLSDTELGWARSPLTDVADPLKEIYGSQHARGLTRLVIELTRRTEYVIEPGAGGLTVRLGSAATSGASQASPSPAPASPSPPPSSPSPTPSPYPLPQGGEGAPAPPSATAAPAPREQSPAPAPVARDVVAGARSPRPVVYGIVLGQRGWVAYIGDPASGNVEAYRVGDALGSGIVEAIEEERVVIRDAAGTTDLRLDDQKPPRR